MGSPFASKAFKDVTLLELNTPSPYTGHVYIESETLKKAVDNLKEKKLLSEFGQPNIKESDGTVEFIGRVQKINLSNVVATVSNVRIENEKILGDVEINESFYNENGRFALRGFIRTEKDEDDRNVCVITKIVTFDYVIDK